MFFAKCPGYLVFRSSNSENLTLQLHSLLIVVYFCIAPEWYLRAVSDVQSHSVHFTDSPLQLKVYGSFL